MTEPAPVERQIWLVRHGETDWARLGRHTGRTDIPLTDIGRAQAAALGRRLADRSFSVVLTSPLSRAADTARIAGFGDRAEPDANLLEWDYGDLEGRTTAEIRAAMPDWSIWNGPWPGGETVDEVGARVDRVIAACLAPEVTGDVLLFAHGHVLRVLTARWLRLAPAMGCLFALRTATTGVLGWDHDNPVVETWNEACHLETEP